MTSTVSSRVHADLALAVYLEPHVEGRRVLLLAEAQGALADRFDRLASYLEIIDPAAREPSRGQVPELPFDDRSFDLVLVCDAAKLPEPTAAALRELRRVLSRTGLLALASPLPARRRRRGPPPQVALEKLLSSEFRQVRVLAQAPLSGYALGELERQRGEEFTIDSSLVREQRSEPERLVGLASDAGLPLESRLWVELPVPQEAAESSEQEQAARAGLIEELRRAEDEAREALHRESDLLRKLELERGARAEAEHLAERARSFERKLLAAEADYDDAVARVRYFESAIAEREAAARHDRERREASERELAQLKSELAASAERVQRLQAERDAARADFEASAGELGELEQRLVAMGKQVLELEQGKKQHEQTARDLLEELRRLEQDKQAAVEHDARVAELEAERDRALQRALEAEVAREAAQMRVDELRTELEAVAHSRRAQLAPEPAAVPAPRAREPRAEALEELRAELGASSLELEQARRDATSLRGECQGLRMRMNELETALGAAASPGELLGRALDHNAELRLRLSHTEAALHHMREAPPAQRAVHEREPGLDPERVRELEEQLAAADRRLTELSRELEEADRFAELHAEDAERLANVEAEMEHSRGRFDELEDELRALDEELRNTRDELGAVRGELKAAHEELSRARANADKAAAEAAARLELAERREAERDDARAALAEARSILSQLAGGVGADENDPPSIMQALLAQRDSRAGDSERVIDGLRAELALRDARIEELERWLAEARTAADASLSPPQPSESPEH